MADEEQGLIEVTQKLMELVRDNVRASQLSQGHNNTGKLYESIAVEVMPEQGQVIGRLYAEDYASYVEVGVSADKVPFGGNSTGAKTSKYIQALIGYFEDKGLSGRDSVGAAFGTAHKHKREGMPTRASSRFSETGKRLGFIRTAIEESSNEMLEVIETNFGKTIELFFLEDLYEHIKIA